MQNLQWLNHSHPQTTQAAVVLGYISGIFALLGGSSLLLIAGFLMLGGAFGMANNKKAGWVALLIGSGVLFIARALGLVFGTLGLNFTLMTLNNLIFPAALVAAVLHPHTREYMRAWFE